MDERDYIDDLIKEKLDGREFPFDEFNWDKAERMIIRTQNVSRFLRIGSIFTGGFILGLLVTFSFIRLGNKPLSPTPVPSSSQVGNTPITPLSPAKTVISQSRQKESNTKINTMDREATAPARKVPQYSADNSQLAVSATESANVPGQAVISNPAPSSGMSSSPIVSQPGVSASNPNRYPAPHIALNSLSPSYNPSTSLAEITPLEPNLYYNRQDNYTTTNISPVDNSKFSKYTTFFPTHPPSTLSITWGFDYAFGWNNNTGREAEGFNPVVGLSYIYYFNKNWGLAAGIEYYSLSRINSYYSSTNAHYGFGETDTTTAVHPHTLYYASVPLQIVFNPSSKNSIEAGVSFLYLINTRSELIEYSQSTLSPEESTLSSANTFGYEDGFSIWDFQPTFTYTRKFSSSFSISLQGYLGLVNVKQNGFFELENNQNDRNEGLKIMLNYTIIK